MNKEGARYENESCGEANRGVEVTIAVFLPDGPAARVCTEIAQRQSMNPRTYSAPSRWTPRQRLQRAKEVAMDQVVDLQREIEALDAKEASRG